MADPELARRCDFPHGPAWATFAEPCPQCCEQRYRSAGWVRVPFDEAVEREAAFDWHAEYAEAIFDNDVPAWEQVDPDSVYGSIKRQYVEAAGRRLLAALKGE